MSETHRGLQSWTDLLSRHYEPHLVVGWTRNVNRWRDESFFDLVAACDPAGHYAFRRDLDEARGQFLVLAVFENERAALEVAEAIGAEAQTRYPGYASQFGFKYGGKLTRTLRAALTSRKSGGRPA